MDKSSLEQLNCTGRQQQNSGHHVEQAHCFDRRFAAGHDNGGKMPYAGMVTLLTVSSLHDWQTSTLLFRQSVVLYMQLAVTVALQEGVILLFDDSWLIVIHLPRFGREVRNTLTYKKEVKHSFRACCELLEERAMLICKYRKGTISPITRNETKYVCFWTSSRSEQF